MVLGVSAEDFKTSCGANKVLISITESDFNPKEKPKMRIRSKKVEKKGTD